MKSTTANDFAVRIKRLTGDGNTLAMPSNEIYGANKFDDQLVLDAMNHAIKTYANVTDRTRRETYYTIDANGESRLPFDNLELKQAVVSIDDLFDVTITTTANQDEVAVNSTVDFDYTVASTILKDHSEYNKVWTLGSDTATTDTYSKLIETPGEYGVSLLLQDSETKQSDTDSLAFKAYLSPTITISGEENPIVGDPYTYTINVTNSIYWPETYEWSTSETTQSVVKTFATAGAHTFSGKASIVDHPTFTSGFVDKTVNAYIPYQVIYSDFATSVDGWSVQSGSGPSWSTGYIYSYNYGSMFFCNKGGKFSGNRENYYGGKISFIWQQEYTGSGSDLFLARLLRDSNYYIVKKTSGTWNAGQRYTENISITDSSGWLKPDGSPADETYIRYVLSSLYEVSVRGSMYGGAWLFNFTLTEEPV